MSTLKNTLFLMLLFAATNMSAQTLVFGPKVSYTDNFKKSKEGKVVGNGFNVGAFMAFSPGNGIFTLQPELLYSRYTRRNSSFYNNTVKFNYLEIPLAFKTAILINGTIFPHVYAGPYTAIKLKASTEPFIGAIPENYIEREFRSVDFGAIIGFGVDIKSESGVINADFRYYLGGTQLEKAGFAQDIKYNSFALSVGFGFWLY